MQVKYSYNMPTPGGVKQRKQPQSQIQTVLGQVGPKAYTPVAKAAPVVNVNPLSYSDIARSAPSAQGAGVQSGSGAFAPPNASTMGGAMPEVDYSGDPVLQQIRQNAQGMVATGVGGANSQIKQALIGYGDPNLARQAQFFTVDPNITTQGDEEAAQAAAVNPLSTVHQLEQAHQKRLFGLDQNLQDANLYYSSTRGNELGNENQQYLGEQAGAQAQLSGALTAAVRDLLGMRDTAQGNIASGEQGAYERALQYALQNASYPADPSVQGGALDPSGGGPGGISVHGAAPPFDPYSLMPSAQPSLGSGLAAPIPHPSTNPTLQSGILGALAAQLRAQQPPAADPRQAGILGAIAAQLRGGRPTQIH